MIATEATTGKSACVTCRKDRFVNHEGVCFECHDRQFRLDEARAELARLSENMDETCDVLARRAERLRKQIERLTMNPEPGPRPGAPCSLLNLPDQRTRTTAMPDMTAATAPSAAEATSLYVRATLTDGSAVVSQFGKLEGIETYARQVFAGSKPFNVWTVVHTTHPASGEACLVRRRRVVPGSRIAELEVVEPVQNANLEPTADGLLDPSQFQPALHIQKGEAGLHTFEATEDLPEGAVAGIGYPIHREAFGYSFLRYVILRVAQDGAEELRHWIDPRPTEPVAVTNGEPVSPGDGDDDFGDDGDEDF
jgi:hypothetical protein